MAAIVMITPTEEVARPKSGLDRELETFLEALALLEFGVLPKSA